MSIVLILVCALVSVANGSSLFDEDLYHKVLDSELCDQQLETMDASEFYDASFRAPQGLLGGNFVNYGNYHQCLAIRQDFPSSSIEGKYCVVKARLAAPTLKIPSLGGASGSDNLTWTEWNLDWSRDEIIQYLYSSKSDIEVTQTALSSNRTSPVIRAVSVSLGVCVPKACTADAVLRPYAEHPLLKFNYTEKFCRLPEDKPLVGADYAVFAILSLFGVLTIMSTAYELRHTLILKKDPATANEWFLVCSLCTNTRQLLTFSGSSRPLDCLDGIRSLSVLWIIVLHTYYLISMTFMNKLEGVQEDFRHKYTWIWAGGLAVDTFLALSGLLLVYTAARKMKQRTLLSGLHMFYLNRYVRLFPHLVTALMLYTSPLLHIADGPNWTALARVITTCRTYWWSSLLHVQNIFNYYNQCMDHTWYLSVDWQLYLVSPLVLYWTLGGTRRAGGARAAWCALGAAVVASLAATLALCFFHNYPDSGHDGLGKEFLSYYYNVVTRSPPFFIGMVCGYALHVCRERKVQLPKWSVFLCHGVALLMSFCVTYGPLLMPVDSDNQLVVNLKNSFVRATWAVCLCWLIFACSHGYGGPVNWFLSLRLWRLPARLSYAMYLYAYPLQHILIFSSPAPYYLDMRALLSVTTLAVAWSAAAAAAASVLLEAPLLALYALLLQRMRSKPNTTQ